MGIALGIGGVGADYSGAAGDFFQKAGEMLCQAGSGAIDDAVSGITGAADSTRILVDDMAGITARMGTNQEIVGELKQQMEVFANL